MGCLCSKPDETAMKLSEIGIMTVETGIDVPNSGTNLNLVGTSAVVVSPLKRLVSRSSNFHVSIFRFPAKILLESIIIPFLSLMDLARIDSSFTEHDYRNILQNDFDAFDSSSSSPRRLFSIIVFLDRQIAVRSFNQLEWMVSRNIKCHNININNYSGIFPVQRSRSSDNTSIVMTLVSALFPADGDFNRHFNILHLNLYNCSALEQNFQILLKYLDVQTLSLLSNNSSKPDLSKVLSKCTHLRRLKWKVIDSEILALTPLIECLEVDFSLFGLTSVGIQAISRFESLLELSLSTSTSQTDVCLLEVARKCLQLQKLSAAVALLTDECAALFIANCVNLWFLSFSGCQLLTDETTRAIGLQAHSLRAVHISSCPLINDEGMMLMAEHCSRLEEVKLPIIKSDCLLHAIAKNCSSLHTLVLCDDNSPRCSGRPLTNHALCQLLIGCCSLTSIDIHGDSTVLDCIAEQCGSRLTCLHLNQGEFVEISDDKFNLIARKCVNLRDVLVRNRSLSDCCIQQFAISCQQLTKFSINSSRVLTDTGLASIGQYCKQLSHFSLATCGMITVVGVHAVAEACTNLSYISVGACAGVHKKALKLRPRIYEVNVF